MSNGLTFKCGELTHDYWQVDRAAKSAIYSYAKNMRKNATQAEDLIWQELRGRRLGGFKFVRQKPMGYYIPDFLCIQKRLIIEIDGQYHNDPSVALSDRVREQKFAVVGYKILRFTNQHVFTDITNILQTIHEELIARQDRPLPYPTEIYCENTAPLPPGEGAGGGVIRRSMGRNCKHYPRR